MIVNNDYVITIDIDWAPDFAIDYVAEILIENNVKATWFVTHQSEAIEKLKTREDLFELGIHPNLLENSTHGKTADEVLAHILEIVPGAKSMRTHDLYQSSSFLAKASVDYGIAADLSLFLPRAANLVPHRIKWSGANLWRFPHFWEDDVEMSEDDPIWELSDERLDVPGLRIFDFHPVHIFLNTPKFEYYNDLKQRLPVSQWSANFVAKNVNEGRGPKSIFLELAVELSNKGARVKDLILELE